jgi:hypothetical protein
MNINLIPELAEVIYDAASSGKLARPEVLAAMLVLFPKCPHCGRPGVWGAVVAKGDGLYGAALIAPGQYWHADFTTKDLATRELRRRGLEIERSFGDCSARLN